MRSFALVLACASCLTSAACDSPSSPGSSCTPTVLMSGGLAPADQGWATFGCGDPASTDGTRLTVDTETETGCAGDPYSLHSMDVGLLPGTATIIEWRMKVDHADPHNTYDAGVAFLPAFTGSFGTAGERSQMIYFEEGAIGWADDAASFAVDTTAAARLYRLEVDAGGNAQVFVDGALALTRTGLTLNGTIAFGDQTNDPNVDGAFAIDFIRTGCP